MRLTFIFTDKADLESASKYNISRVHFDFPDEAFDLPDYRERLTAIAELVGQLTRASLYVVCEPLGWKQRKIRTRQEDGFIDRAYISAVLGFEALRNVREKYKYLNIRWACVPPTDKSYLYPPWKVLRKNLSTSLFRGAKHPMNEEQQAYQAIFDQLADHCLTLLNTNPSEQRRYMGFYPRWHDYALANEISRRADRDRRKEEREKKARERQEAKAKKAAEPKKEYIYFIQQGDDGPIKVGYSTNPEKRLKTLSTASPHSLHLLKVVEGDETLEKRIHTRFAEIRLGGEWLQATQDLLDFIESLE